MVRASGSYPLCPGFKSLHRHQISHPGFTPFAGLNAPVQNRAIWFVPFSEIQKLTPSLHAPICPVPGAVGNEPRGVRSAAFQRETMLPVSFVTRTRCPSKAAATGEVNPFPVSVFRIEPFEARTTETEPEKLGTQRFVPSKAGITGLKPTVTV